MRLEKFKAISERLGKKSIELTLLSDPNVDSIVKNWIPTSSIALNHILGGGLPCGRLTEIFGDEAAGKSSLVADIIANTQKMGGTAVIIDSEQVFEPKRAASMGVDLSNVLHTTEPTVEGAFDVMNSVLDEYVAEHDAPLCIVWDSVAASPTASELNGDVSDVSPMAEKARLLSKGLRQIQSKIGKHTALVFINQVRTDFNIRFGKKTQASGGKGLRYAASVRLEITRIGSVKEGEKVIGITCKVETKKSKVSAPSRSVFFDMFYKGGIDDSSFLLEKLVELGVVRKKAAWYAFGEGKKELKFQAKNFSKVLADLGDEANSLIAKALEAI